MIEELKPYENARDAAAGLPRLPAHWAVRRTKSLLREIDRRTKTGTERLLSLRMNAGLVDHHALGGKFIPSSALVGYKHVLPGEIVMNRMRAAIGLFGAAVSEGLVSPDYAIFSVRPELNVGYAVSLFKTPAMTSLFRLESRGLGTGESGFLRLYSDRFGVLPMPLPPLKEQLAIVRFLDHANRRIDQFIRSKKKLIALLNEQKQAIIHLAVTRGLGTSVQLKDSGMPWLGQIPAHWEVNRLKSLTRFVTSGSRGWARFYSDIGPLFLRIGNISTTSVALRLDKLTRVSPPADAEGERTQVEAGDVLLSITAQIGAVGLVPEGLGEAYVNQHTALIRLRDGSCDRRWIAYQLLSRFGKDQCRLLTNGGTKMGLSLDDVRGLVVLLPPQREQSAIVEEIVRSTAGLEKQIALTERETVLVREYRSRIIADVVTGQLDVRAAAASLPDLEPDAAPIEPEGDEDTDIDDNEAA